jgi:hypothetical protein
MPIDSATHDSVVALIRETYARISTPGSDAGSLFDDVDIAIAGSGQGELVAGPEMAGRMANGVAGLGFRWTADTITVWRRGDVAWAQILGTVLDYRRVRAGRRRLALAVLGRVGAAGVSARLTFGLARAVARQAGRGGLAPRVQLPKLPLSSSSAGPSCMTMRRSCIVMRGMRTPSLRHDRTDPSRSARPPASGPVDPARAAANARPAPAAATLRP